MLTIPFRNKLNTKHIQMDIHGFPFERERGHVCVTKTCVEANLSTTYFLWTIGAAAAAVVEYSRYPRLCFFVAIIIYERKGGRTRIWVWTLFTSHHICFTTWRNFCLYLCPLERSFMFDFFWLLVSFLLLLLNRRALKKHVNGLCSHWPAICRSSQGGKTVPRYFTHFFRCYAASIISTQAPFLQTKKLDRTSKSLEFFDILDIFISRVPSIY